MALICFAVNTQYCWLCIGARSVETVSTVNLEVVRRGMIQLTGDWLGPGEATVLLILIALATLGTVVLFLIATAGAIRRRNTTYLLLTVAIGLLVARSFVGLGTVFGAVPMPVHHLAGHGVDLSIALLVLAAIFIVDSPDRPD
ncbi:DUF7471 family protein [Haloarcula laminariae]